MIVVIRVTCILFYYFLLLGSIKFMGFEDTVLIGIAMILGNNLFDKNKHELK